MYLFGAEKESVEAAIKIKWERIKSFWRGKMGKMRGTAGRANKVHSYLFVRAEKRNSRRLVIRACIRYKINFPKLYAVFVHFFRCLLFLPCFLLTTSEKQRKKSRKNIAQFKWSWTVRKYKWKRRSEKRRGERWKTTLADTFLELRSHNVLIIIPVLTELGIKCH